ncbi:MAG: dehydratase [Actinobacteria bacterium]|nr:dehydratase [Actinomycetota bacterium]
MNFTVGEVLPNRTFSIDRRALKAYADASGDQNPIHQDEAFAKSVGLPNVIAHGMFTLALGGTYISDLIGGPSKIRKFGARFTKPVVVPADEPAQVEFSGTVASIENGIATIELTALHGDQKVLGMAKAEIVID